MSTFQTFAIVCLIRYPDVETEFCPRYAFGEANGNSVKSFQYGRLNLNAKTVILPDVTDWKLEHSFI